MDRTELISKTKDIKASLETSHNLFSDLYNSLLDDYFINIYVLKHINDMYIWEQVLELQEKYDQIKSQLPNVSDEVFDEFIITGDLLAVLLE